MKKITQGKISYLREFSKKIKKNILDMALVAGSSSSHLGGALSITDILTVLFSKELIRVVIHGLLHLIGYKDGSEKEKKRMRSLENKYLSLYKNL